MYDAVELNERLVRTLRPTTPAIVMKYVKNEEQLSKIKNLHLLAKRGGPCVLIGSVIAFNCTFGIRKERISKLCGGTCGCCDDRTEFLSGSRISTDFKWHGSLETAHEHMMSTVDDLPACDSIAVVLSPMSSGDIEAPDVVILSLEPCAAYHLLAGYEEGEFTELIFKFRGEASCIESWNYTYATGKIGMTLGDRGNRNHGALAANEIRLTMTLPDLARALDGVDRLAKNGIIYPYGTTHVFPECE